MKKDIFLKKKKKTKVIAIDLDGTLSRYKGWKGEHIIHEPLPGSKEFLEKLKGEGWKIIIFTTRYKKKYVRQWLRKWKMPYDEINSNIYEIRTSGKVIADIYLDDRALLFTGDYKKALKKIKNFNPWYLKGG